MRVVCVSCKKSRQHHAKGLCQKCYNNSHWHKEAQARHQQTDKYLLSMIRCYTRKLSPKARKALKEDMRK